LKLIKVRSADELAVDPVRHLLELRKRIRKKKAEARTAKCRTERSFWVKENGERLSYDGIRKANKEILVAAGIDDTPYHVKHVVMTELKRAGMGSDALAEYGRHKPGSKVWSTNYVDWENGKESLEALLKI
jgi:hypothetical protein